MEIDSVVTHIVAVIALVVGLCYVFGEILKRLRQPEVIGQLLAGIVIGPSVLGHFPGSGTRILFPAQIIPYLNVTSQVALVLFLFAVGYELDFRLVVRHRRTVPAVAVSAFALPMLLGAISVYAFAHLYRMAGESHAGTGYFILFMGVTLSISAVPVMASITRERGITGTLSGVTAMISAAMIDAVSWLALAGVLVMASASSTHWPWIFSVLLLGTYIAVTLIIVRPILRIWLRRPQAPLADKVPMAVVFAAGSAWATAALGLHVIFGAFFAGLVMPRLIGGTSDPDLLRPIQDAGSVLLPLFFVVSGLSVNISALRPRDLVLLGVLCAFAVAGKIGAGFLAARFAKLSTSDSLTVGVLLNTRGLTELIALNVGLQAGIIHQRLYTILVLMALVTTAATGPLLALVRLPEPDVQAVPELATDAAVTDG